MILPRGRLAHLGRSHKAFKPAFYYDHYETHLAVDPNEVTGLLELGVRDGGSLLMWRDVFPAAQIFGVDLNPASVADETARVHQIQANQTDGDTIGAYLRARGVNELDVIIDDCSHIGSVTKQSFWYLYNTFLKPGGYYVIEDWGTGYWESWIDGAERVEPDPATEAAGIFLSHGHGIPGFVKQLIDCTKIYQSLVVTEAFVIIKKQSPENRAAVDRHVKQWQDHGTV
jgi:SAM-dependent methyltransferase